MEAGGTDREEETLQTAFKKLRVDAESLPGSVSTPEASTPRAASRVCLDASGTKAKLGCNKDNWHCCTRKSSRGASRSQRRRRSKSPILHPPKFTYCSAAVSALPPPSGSLKHHRLAVPDPAEPRPVADDGTSCSPAASVQAGMPEHASPLLFGAHHPIATALPSSRWEGVNLRDVRPTEGGAPEESDAIRWRSGAAGAADFRALSELHRSMDGTPVPCSCDHRGVSDSQEAGSLCSCTCQRWRAVEVYSFTGLRGVISECERSLPSLEDTSRTLSSNATAASSSPVLSSGSPRSCSEQARAYVDDITIEDLSGYMEYYLYIPKKMSHMAEMMYT